MTIGKQIKEAREIKGLKQKFVAEKVGVTSEHLSSVERDKNNPSKSLVNILQVVLDTEFNK